MPRFRYAFWLDSDKDDELLLMETIDELKQQYRFVSTVRDGIRLMADLRNGNLDVLFELFPELKNRIRSDEDGSGGDLGDRLDRLESLLLQMGTPAGVVAAARETMSRPRPKLEVKVDKEAGKQAEQNLISGLLALGD